MQTSFNKGLWSPKLQNRFDVDQYRSACSELDNFAVLPQGGIFRRNGSVYLLEAYDNTKKSILVPLQLDKDTLFIVEFSGNQKMRILSFNAATRTLTVEQDDHVTGFTDAKLDEVQWVQINKKLYVTHKDHAPRKLSRITDTDWLWTEVSHYPPAQRVNRYDPAGTLTLASASGNEVNFSLSSNWFMQGDAGKFLVADATNGKAGYAVITSWTNATNGVCSILETFNDTDLAAGEWYLQGSGGGRMSIQYPGPEGRKCRVTVDSIIGGDAFFRAADEGRYMEINEGFVKLVKYVAGNQMDVIVIKCPASSAPTYNWLLCLPEWMFTERHPKTVAFYENRLFYGGTIEKAGNVWGSRSQFYNDFTPHSDDEYMLQYLLSGSTLHEILWMIGSQVLTVGTTNGIWTIGREDTSAVLTPTAPMLGFQSTISCAGIRPATIGNVIFFVQRNKKILRSFEASSTIKTNKATPSDETIFADPFTKSNIVQLVAQSNPYIILWVTNDSGELWGLNYVQEQEVNSWFKATTSGQYESLMICPQEDDPDLLFYTVKRVVNGTAKKYIEYMHNTSAADSMRLFTAGGTTHTLTGYTHLLAEKVWVCTAEQGWLRDTDENIHEFTVTAGGNINITGWTATSQAWAGLPYISEAKTMNWYGGPSDFTYEKLRRLTKLQVTTITALTGEVGVQIEENTTPTYTKIFEKIPSPSFTGVTEVGIQPGTGRIVKLCIRQTQPDALRITGLGCNLK